ncbi:TPR domain-containing protein [Colletotrichum asianum]|uniref:TPR domain-containing protein n=1 Tax=Colletotrichum asianum TaxID=702518 RepID=A0A8H3ZP86_9PEZI|nr:TPR domain-containing protein [Colletotrichum asianum]
MTEDEEQTYDGRDSPEIPSPGTDRILLRRPSKMKLGNMLFHLYCETRESETLDETISTATQEVSAVPQDDPNLASWLDDLVNMFLCRHEETEGLDDLENAISNAKRAEPISTMANHDPERLPWLDDLGHMLFRRYVRTGDVDDLNVAISTTKEAKPTPTSTGNDHNRASWLNGFGVMLFSRYKLTGNTDDLEAALSNMSLAVSLTPQNDPGLLGLLNNTGTICSSLYEETGNLSYLETAVSYAEQAVSATPKNDPDLTKRLHNLGLRLLRRYERIGSLDDLNSAISMVEQAVSVTPEGHYERPSYLNSLGGLLLNRYDRTGNRSNLEAAILHTAQAVSITPNDHPDISMWKNSLGDRLFRRYQRTGGMHDLEAALLNTTQAISNTPESNPHLATCLNSRGNMLSSQYEETRNMDDLKAAISSMRKAVQITPKGHSNRARLLSNLGLFSFRQYEKTNDMDILDDALRTAKSAVDETPKNHPDLAKYLGNLGDVLFCRYEQTGNIEDRDSALNLFEESTKCPTAIPVVRVQAARRAIRILSDLSMWGRACELAQDAVKLLPSVCDRSLDRQDQHHAVLQTAGLASDACSLFVRTGRVSQALQQVEFGRGLILGYLIDNPSQPIDDVVEPRARDYLIHERTEAHRQLEDCLDRIRRHRGHERFLLEPTLDELLQCATEGPIIIVNVTSISSDAITVSSSGCKAINLPEITPSQVSVLAGAFGMSRSKDGYGETHVRDIKSEKDVTAKYSVGFLSWLWRVCVRPIFTELDIAPSAEPPRMWWIGTGVASSFPFHAAGLYSDRSREDTLSLTVPSYTPTIKSLVYARSCAARDSEKHGKASVLVVAMPETPGQNPLSGVIKESMAIQQALGDVFKVEYLEKPSAKEVMDRMRQSDIVHFACHGSSDRANPLDSHLLLQTTTLEGPSLDKLTVQAISEKRTLEKARIAYLSACSTAEVKDGQLVDEALHIVSAFQVAGFGHVIGSLWSADDETCIQVAKLFYEYLAQDGRRNATNRVIAEALRYATQEVRTGRDPILWAQYIHSGA